MQLSGPTGAEGVRPRVPGPVVVVGSANVDHFIDVPHLPAEGVTIHGSAYRTGAGGKGLNQAVAAARQGARVVMVGAVGDDHAGQGLLDLLDGEGIDRAHVVVDRRQPTGVALITVAAGGANTIVVAAGANMGVAAAPRPVVAAAAVVLTQLEVPTDTVIAALAAARSAGAIGILNPAPAPPAGSLPAELVGLADILVPNESEAAALTGLADPSEAATALVTAGWPVVIVTMGAAGALLADRQGLTALPSLAVDAIDTTAAGDAFCGTLAAALASGSTVLDALRRALAAGALAATAPGAVDSLPNASAVTAALASS